MIPAVHRRGTNVGGLLRYLFGPGKREEHVNAHLVAAWSNAGPVAGLEPATTASGRRDVRRLTELLEQPVASGRNPPRKTVWHCSIRTHPTDRELSDSQWEHIASEVMAAVGLAPHDDDRAVRWVAVRHAADHIHIVATLVRQDRRTAWASNDYRRAQNACRDLEERYGLYRVAPPGAGSRRWSRPQELNKAARLPRRDKTPPRERLRREVRAVAAVADDEADYFHRLAAVGVLVRMRYGSGGEVTGYAVGLPEHTTGAGATVWYGGGRLAADLTLPRLRARWDGEVGGGSSAARLAAQSFAASSAAYASAARAVRAATVAMRASPSDAPAIARETADMLIALARRVGGRVLERAAEAFDRAAFDAVRRPWRRTRARDLSRLIASAGPLPEDLETLLQLIAAFAGIAEALAEIREIQQRAHQTQAAREAAEYLRSYQPRIAGGRDGHPTIPRKRIQATPSRSRPRRR